MSKVICCMYVDHVTVKANKRLEGEANLYMATSYTVL